jgi:hypothetical protein
MILNTDMNNRVPYWPTRWVLRLLLQPHWFHACTLAPVLGLVNRLISLTRQVRVKRDGDALFRPLSSFYLRIRTGADVQVGMNLARRAHDASNPQRQGQLARLGPAQRQGSPTCRT